jgi:hypothetical protein
MSRAGGTVSATWRFLVRLPLPVRGMLLGAGALGVAGGLAGLVLGLRAYPPTAWFAVVEVGVPAAFVGCAIGALAGSAAALWTRGVSRLRRQHL